MSSNVEVVKDELDRPYDPMEVENKDPSRAYRWALKRERNLRRLESIGYEYINATTGKGERVAPNTRIQEHKVPDGTKHIGSEYVLMCIGKSVKEKRDLAKARRAMERVSAARDRFLDEARRAGLMPYEERGDSDSMQRTVELEDSR